MAESVLVEGHRPQPAARRLGPRPEARRSGSLHPALARVTSLARPSLIIYNPNPENALTWAFAGRLSVTRDESVIRAGSAGGAEHARE